MKVRLNILTVLDYKTSLTSQPTPFNTFKKKRNELKNIRIDSFMKDRKHNSALQKYLESKDESESEQILIEDDTGNDIIEIGKYFKFYCAT